MRSCEAIEVADMTDRAQLHHLVDALPDDALGTIERLLAGLFAPAVTDQAGAAPMEDRPAGAAEERLHGFFRRFEGRSLADELIAERREEARRESS